MAKIDKLTYMGNGVEYELLSGDVLVSDQANNIFTPGMKIWGGTESDYQSLTPDSNTAYLLLAGGPTPPSPRQPGVNTIAYYPFDTDFNDYSGNGHNLSNYGNVSITTVNGVTCAEFVDTAPYGLYSSNNIIPNGVYTWLCWINGNPGVVGGNPRMFGGTDDFFILLATEADKYGPQFPADDGIPRANGRHLYCFVGDTSTGNFSGYKDGVYINGGIGVTGSRSGIRIGGNERNTYASVDAFIGYMGAMVFENKARTATEISDYFNATKGDYGIS